MNYQQTINFLFEQLPMFSRMGSAAYKKDLVNIIALSEAIGNPHLEFKSVHVGGTNGKGSVSHMLASVFQQAGYKTGLYTSPHLYDFRERIRINGQMIEEDFVVQFVKKIKPCLEKIEPSFFEITVAMAFDLFAQENIDLAIVEVGMGGRLDSTNIITPELSVITNIGWDHAAFLGDSLQKIAAEKAGIIKPHIPVVIGEKKPETSKVFLDAAFKKNADLVFAEDHYSVNTVNLERDAIEIELSGKNKSSQLFTLDLPGLYQSKNLITSLKSIDILKSRGWEIPDHCIHSGLRNVKKNTGLSGRWEVISDKPLTVLEVAHNKDGVAEMLKHISRLDFSALHLIIGMVKDKDVDDLLELFPAQAKYYFSQADIPRAMPAQQLKEKFAVRGLKGEVFDNVNEALTTARQQASENDLIVICGSIFFVAEVRRN